MAYRSTSIAAVLLFSLSASQAAAQSYVRPECQKLIAPAGLEPGSTTERWYRRFWTGDCRGLSGCFGGSPNWNEVVAKLTARAKPAEKSVVLVKSCKLGPLIGLEWTKPKKVRRIDTGDLRGFNGTLERAGDVATGIDKVEAQARAKIAGR
jgi:hypothetical protein